MQFLEAKLELPDEKQVGREKWVQSREKLEFGSFEFFSSFSFVFLREIIQELGFNWVETGYGNHFKK